MYLFFVRAFNDVDHLTPIVWKMSQDNYPVAVYCINPEYDILNDYRLDFLRGVGVKVDYIYGDFDRELGVLHRVMRFLFQRSYALQRRFDVTSRSLFSSLSNRLRLFSRKIGNLLYKLSRSKFYDLRWARNVLEHTGAKALCFDWARPERYVVDVFLTAAKELSIPTLALPHGVYLYTNDFVSIRVEDDWVRHPYNRFDYVVVQNSLFKEVLPKSGVEREKIFVLGSARYCDEWMEQNNKLLPRMMKSTDGKTDKLKVVFMTTRPKYSIDVERILRTFDILSKINGIEVVVKPHTRTGKETNMYNNLPLANVSDLSSVELCEWADVMLVIGSSIIIEALKRGKPALYLKYLHENTTDYEALGACWIINDETELQNALLALQKSKKDVPYTDENVNRYLAGIIYGGKNERDVLQDYEDFILNSAGQ